MLYHSKQTETGVGNMGRVNGFDFLRGENGAHWILIKI